MMLPITAIYAGVLTLIYLALTFRVIAFRRGNQVSLGDGDSKDLQQRMRAHGNFAEFAPLGIIILACVELQGAPVVAVHVLGMLLLLGRGLHAAGLWVHPMNFRFRTAGMFLTLLMLLAGAVGLILHSVL